MTSQPETSPATAPFPDATAANVGGLGFLLDRVAHSLSRAFAEALAPAGLSATALGLLSALIRWGPMTQSELAAFLGVERQQALHLVDALSAKNYVTRRPRPGDRRMWDVEVTPSGRQARDAASAAVSDHEQAVFSVLSREQRDTLAELLHQLAGRGRYAQVLQPPARRD